MSVMPPRRERLSTRSLLLLFAVTLFSVSLLLRLDALGYLGYQMERGRLRALRETLPEQMDLASVSYLTRQVAAAVGPSVVQIETFITTRGPGYQALLERMGINPSGDSDDPHHGVPFGDDDSPPAFRMGFGSGFVIDAARGYLLTNEHVIRDADEIRVRLTDGRVFLADVVGSDAKTDLAVIAIEPDKLHELPLGDSGFMEIGDEVLAVGNPFGQGVSFSRGIISAKGRDGRNIIIGDVEYRGFLQTDAVINPGNSGGPLVNMSGEVIGINMAIASRTGSSEGVGFAIPSDRVQRLLPRLLLGGPVVRGFLGVHIYSVLVVRERAQELGWEHSYGVLVSGFAPDSPARDAGLQVNDIIVSFAGRDMLTGADLLDAVALVTPGSEVTVELWRDGAFHERSVRLIEQPPGFHTSPNRRIEPRGDDE
ncbi:MAG: trypsin-like peptidase domain-containing protein [Planctomycetes bacterium]|nr:trypsin-like peptidase domain-containing protein [Planctomycetota bacterium]